MEEVKAETVVGNVLDFKSTNDVAPEKKFTTAPLEPVVEPVPDGMVKFEFDPEARDQWGREIDKVSVLVGWSRTFEKVYQPFFIAKSDWSSLQSHAPKVFREIK